MIDNTGTVSVAWSDLTGIPADFADGTDDLGDTLPSCVLDQVLFFDGASWTCLDVDDHTHDAAQVVSGTLDLARLPMGTGTNTVAYGDHLHPATGLDTLSCADTEIARYNDSAGVWECSVDADTLSGLGCNDGELARWNGSASSWECARPAAGLGNLVLALEFDEAGGTTFADSAGGGNDASVVGGAVAAGAAGNTGNGLAFVGGRAAVPAGNTIPDVPYLTVEAWVNPNLPLTGAKTIVEKVGGYTLYLSDDTVSFTVEGRLAQCNVTSVATVAGNTWTHLRASYDGRIVSVSVDDLDAEVACVGGPITPTPGAPLNIGALDDDSRPFDGTIDELRLWAGGRDAEGNITGDLSVGGDATIGGTLTVGGADVLDRLMPAGAVLAFNLASCPAGWSPADGTSGTLDLAGRFPLGVGALPQDASVTIGLGDAAGSHRYRLGIDGYAEEFQEGTEIHAQQTYHFEWQGESSVSISNNGPNLQYSSYANHLPPYVGVRYCQKD